MTEDPTEVARAFSDAPGRLTDLYLQFRRRHATRTLQVADVPWEYTLGGEGAECVVLLAGGARFGDTWFGLASELEEDYRVVAPTDPGVCRITDLIEGLVAILDAEEVRRAHIVGTSLGGLVAQCLTREHPARVISMILSNTILPSSLPAVWIRLALKASRLQPTWMLRRAVHWNMAILMTAEPEDRAFWKSFWKYKSTTHLRHLTREQALSQYRLVLDASENRHFSSADLASWDGTVGLIESADDIGYIRRAQASLRELYPEARIHRFDRAGHTPGYSRPEEFARVLRSFLRG